MRISDWSSDVCSSDLIGIMNIMLVSVTERTREIGIRLAIGAVAREVLMQFLVEAVVLACLGGVLGILIALIASLVLAPVIQVPFTFDWQSNLLAFVFSAAIGVVFGYFPAKRAAALNPRSEEHTSELQSLMRISYAVFCLKQNRAYKRYY